MNWKPGPVVWAVLGAGVISIWVVMALSVFYAIHLSPTEVAVNTVIFMVAVGWWTQVMKDN